MDAIFHERQEGQLCAQHCLNNLLQGPYFTAVDLANFARELDEDERMRMAEGGVDSPQYLRFLKQPSANMDDSGYFSVQVISRALEVWLLTMTPITSPQMKGVLENPILQQAFICNHDNHWLTVRKLGMQWFDLNSLHRKPELVSDTYLSLFLTQLQLEGYTIFVVEGDLPPSEADQLLSLVPIKASTDKTSKACASGRQTNRGVASRSKHEHERDDEEEYSLELAKALSASMATTGEEVRGQHCLSEDEELEIASALSQSTQNPPLFQEEEDCHQTLVQQVEHQSSNDPSQDEERLTGQLSPDELRQKRLLRFEQAKRSDETCYSPS